MVPGVLGLLAAGSGGAALVPALRALTWPAVIMGSMSRPFGKPDPVIKLRQHHPVVWGLLALVFLLLCGRGPGVVPTVSPFPETPLPALPPPAVGSVAAPLPPLVPTPTGSLAAAPPTKESPASTSSPAIPAAASTAPPTVTAPPVTPLPTSGAPALPSPSRRPFEPWQLALGVSLDPGEVGGLVSPMLIGVDPRCPEPPLNALADIVPGCHSLVPPFFGGQFSNYLDYPRNGPPPLRRLSLSLLPPGEGREWVVRVENLGYAASLTVDLSWSPYSIPATVDLWITESRLLSPPAGELGVRACDAFTGRLSMRTCGGLILTLPAAPSAARVVVRATPAGVASP